MSTEAFKLNPGQRQVIDHAAGPLLVVAGAGTGKTSVIVEKIGRLLDDGVAPSAILAVTFTEKAAAEMLDRLLLSRSGMLPELPIMTFNGYGHSVLQEFGVHIGLSSSFRLLSEQGRIVFFRERVDQFSLDYFLPISGLPDNTVKDILNHFGRLKQNLVTPEAYVEYAGNLPEADEADKLDKIMHQELADTFATYTALCRTENVIDYDDQIFLAIQLLEQRPNVRRQLQERYQTIFVDEFQDTNPMQSRLIDLIVGKDQNIIVVGDDDQAIYGWRGATLSNILGFKDKYPTAAEVALTENYRSSQAILDASYQLIQHNNPDRLEASLGLSKRLTGTTAGNPPQLVRLTDPEAEVDWLADNIAERISNGEEPGSIAVLVRGNAFATKVHEALSINNVPHRVVGQNPDLYTRPVVRMMIELIRTVADPSNNASLHHTLASPLFRIPNNVLAPLVKQARYEHADFEALLQASENPEAMRGLGLINSWRDHAATLPVGNLVWQALVESGYKDHLFESIQSGDNQSAEPSHIKQFFKSLGEFQRITIQPTAAQYLLSLPALSAAGEDTDDTLDIPADSVTVSTIHKAKGLEWDTVYVPRLNERAFPLQSNSRGLQLPEALKVASETEADEHLSEERRLMYVAATRARHNLVLSFHSANVSGVPKKPSRFIDELFGAGTADAADPYDFEPTTKDIGVAPDESEPVTIPTSIYDGNRVRLSASQANVLLSCPLNFYYKYIREVPEEPTAKTSYGTQLHSLFEEINKQRKAGNLQPLSHYVTDLETGWSRGGFVTRAQADRALKQAKDTLEWFYDQAKTNPPVLYIEDPFEIDLQPENIILHGRIDVVLDGEKGLEIRDYKTGSAVSDQKQASERARATNQLKMYALAWSETHDGQIPNVSLQFVDKKITGVVGVTQKGLDGLRGRLQKVAEDLKNGHFPAGGYKHDHCLHPPLDEQ